MFFDAHTHHQTIDKELTAITNFIVGDEPVIAPSYLFSAGIHPWYVYKINEQFVDLEQFILFKNCKAVGEIGLDKKCETNFDLQLQIFEKCLTVAQHNKKPIVIHCVKAQNEILQILKKCNFKEPVLIHGFNQNKIILDNWLKANCYISLGTALLKETSNAFKLIEYIPLNKLLLETDDAPVTIQEIYELAAIKLSMPIEKLKAIIETNFKEFYSI